MLKFPSVDPKSDQYPGISPYSYALNNPLLFVDPTGEYVVAASGRYVTRQSRGMLGTISFFQHIPGGSALIATAIKADLSRDPSVTFSDSDMLSLAGGGVFKGLRYSLRAASRMDNTVDMTMAAMDYSYHGISVASSYLLSQDAALFVDEMVFQIANRKGLGFWYPSNPLHFKVYDRVIEARGADLHGFITSEFSKIEEHIKAVAFSHNLDINTRHGRQLLRYLLKNINKDNEIEDDDVEKP